MAAPDLTACRSTASNRSLPVTASPCPFGPRRVSRALLRGLEPLVDRLRALLLQRQVLHADETPSAATRSRRGENQTPLSLSLLWAYRSNDLEPSDSRGLAAHRRSLCPRLARPRTRRGRPAAAA
ncbi:IS66 family transposase [Pseudomonas aeruginosa]|uniref:IS66 family transposase n=1 Tax=Pseudomonas aeruginosa TaxID=287 RepID=UPI000F848E4E|nr:hypothetical protein DY981_30220 [Pseudomonas aeruginosa]